MDSSKDSLLSIVMPVKNTSEYLEACLDSILSQQYQDWELIAVDDHSSDHSLSILHNYAILDGRVHVYKNRGQGIIDALRTAYAHAQGSYITRMDSDDLMHPEKLIRLYETLETHKGQACLAVGLVEYFSDGVLGDGYQSYAKWLNRLTVTANNFLEIYKECPIPSPCWMCSREVLNAAGAFDSNTYPEDYDLAFRMKALDLQIVPVDQVIHYWRDYQNRTSRTDPNYSDNRFTNLKIKYFLEQDHEPDLELILWGAGHKGKAIAKSLIDAHVTFTWICNNQNKIGRDIYGIILMGMDHLSTAQSGQVISSISAAHDAAGTASIIEANDQLQFYRFS